MEIYERIGDLGELIDKEGLSSPKVKKEIAEVMDLIENEKNIEIQFKAKDMFLRNSFNMLYHAPLFDIYDENGMGLGSQAHITKEVSVKVQKYNDAILIKIDKKVPYRNLIDILDKSTDFFKDKMHELLSVVYDTRAGEIMLSYVNESDRDIIVDVNEWNLQKESIMIYTEGFVEYLKK